MYNEYLENKRFQKNYSNLMKSQKSLASSLSKHAHSQTSEASDIRASEEVSGKITRLESKNESTFSTKQSRS